MTYRLNLLHKLLLCGFVVLASTPARAQITPDNTLGAESSRLTPNVPIAGENGDRIDGGATRGSNLFHSFSQFNVDDGQRVYFGNPNGIENILTRVTGGNASNILGTLGVNGGANLFLINPNGIIFGQNARLDLRGSFVGTTANAIGFGEQGNFSATNPAAPPLLTVNPSVLLYTQIKSGAIANQGLLAAQTGQSLVLAGGDINSNSGSIAAQGGRIELAAIAGTGTVGLNADNSLSIPTEIPRADIALSNSQIGVTAGNNSGMAIHARNLNISGNSLIYSQIGSDVTAVDPKAGDITLDATNTMQIKEGSLIANVVAFDESGKGGNINVTTGSLSLSDGAQIYASTFGSGDAGSVFVQALDSVSAAGNSKIFSTVESGAKGKGGNVNITAPTLSLTDGGQLLTFVGDVSDNLPAGQGIAGNVNVNVSGDVTISGENDQLRSGIFSYLGGGAKGKGGNINVKTGSLSVTDGAQIGATTYGIGDAGSVFVQALDSLSVAGNSPIFSIVQSGAKGKGGSVNVTTGSLSLSDGAEISASTFGTGDAGSVFVQALDSLSVAGNSDIKSTVESGAVGNGGDVNITAPTLSLTDGGRLFTYITEASDNLPAGQGIAGNVNANVSGDVTISGVNSPSGIFSYLGEGAKGNGGNINVKIGSLSVADGSQIAAITYGIGDAGNVIIEARDRVSFTGTSADGELRSVAQSTVKAPGSGKSGDVRIFTGSLEVTDGAGLIAATYGQGNAGNVIIEARDRVSFTGTNANGQYSCVCSSVEEKSSSGKGGDIRISTGSLEVTGGARLSTSTFGIGDAGNVIINARDYVSFRGTGTTADGEIRSVALAIVNPDASGKGGDVRISTGSLEVTDGANLAASTSGIGDAGNVIIEARDRVSFTGTSADGLFPAAAESSTNTRSSSGKGGDIRISTGSLEVTNGAELNAFTQGTGDAGSVFVQATDSVFVAGNSIIKSTVESGAVGNGGNINIAAPTLSLTDGGQLLTFVGDVSDDLPAGQGKAGDVNINVSGDVTISGENDQLRSGIFSYLGTEAKGKGGNINVKTGSLSLSDGARLSASTLGEGDAGNVLMQALDSVSVAGNSYIFSTVEGGAKGNGGNINITAPTLSLTDGSQLLTYVGDVSDNQPAGQGIAGNVFVDVSGDVTISGVKDGSSGIFSYLGTEAKGKGGSINITANSLSITNGGVIDATTYGKGDAGNVEIKTTGDLTFKNGGQVVAATNGDGNAGNVTVTADGTADFDGVGNGLRSGIFTTVGGEAGFVGRGKGGNINLTSPNISISNDAAISSSSFGEGFAGDINIDSRSVRLNNQGKIAAQTDSGNGGNIYLTAADFLLLRRTSGISTSGGLSQQSGDGGNITINTPFIIALPSEDSDITANAFSGKGGNVTINARIFGIQERSEPSDQTSDITARSEQGVQGQIDITQPDVQPTQGLVELPGQILDASDQIASVCPRGNIAKRPLGEFVVSGRGSLPPNPLELLPGTTSLSPLATLDGQSEANLPKTSPTEAISPTPTAIVEAQGWVKTAQGKIALVANAPSATPNASTTGATCPVSK